MKMTLITLLRGEDTFIYVGLRPHMTKKQKSKYAEEARLTGDEDLFFCDIHLGDNKLYRADKNGFWDITGEIK